MRFYTALIATGLLIGILACSSCSFKQQQVLFQQQNQVPYYPPISQADSGNGTTNYRIRSQDILQIRNLQSTKYIVDDAPSTTTAGATSQGSSQGQTYQVEDDGTVVLPVIGHVQIEGLTRAEAAKKVEALYRKTLLKDPIIELKIVNLKVTIL
ncbi:MAG: polysaccharide biosynthesis/export family protein, partial [Mucilaginibacter sp.]